MTKDYEKEYAMVEMIRANRSKDKTFHWEPEDFKRLRDYAIDNGLLIDKEVTQFRWLLADHFIKAV